MPFSNMRQVGKLPKCSECDNDAEFHVITPVKVEIDACYNHFLSYVETRLGAKTVSQYVMVQKGGGK